MNPIEEKAAKILMALVEKGIEEAEGEQIIDEEFQQKLEKMIEQVFLKDRVKCCFFLMAVISRYFFLNFLNTSLYFSQSPAHPCLKLPLKFELQLQNFYVFLNYSQLPKTLMSWQRAVFIFSLKSNFSFGDISICCLQASIAFSSASGSLSRFL